MSVYVWETNKIPHGTIWLYGESRYKKNRDQRVGCVHNDSIKRKVLRKPYTFRYKPL